ncbi:hypothetical protein GLOTRDRAFT_134460 [Gloeophyllum trabeum ATCC 11539]|uniref:Uncharacterized protein n=1 Tax=Gloeophyllum trabeum (strain ATCC 11539 / FP-39264 / Madison 617) TaxID=670483 RepID=S7PR19_GLOTA|nr:uncharacterized protein GLOTRDRAFT_134460 [Gloeophyllum trabeum ATCC 11539]EPQ49918.1 hypothetical protein GLOTRDRAFT_134460 [Gloeophyllum trabeum ATCC 11539]
MLTVIDILFTKAEATCLSSPQAMSSPINAGGDDLTEPHSLVSSHPSEEVKLVKHTTTLAHSLARIDHVFDALPTFECGLAALDEEVTQEEWWSMLAELTNLPYGAGNLFAAAVHPTNRDMKGKRPEITTSSVEVGTSNTSPTASADLLPTTPTDDDGSSTVVPERRAAKTRTLLTGLRTTLVGTTRPMTPDA